MSELRGKSLLESTLKKEEARLNPQSQSFIRIGHTGPFFKGMLAEGVVRIDNKPHIYMKYEYRRGEVAVTRSGNRQKIHNFWLSGELDHSSRGWFSGFADFQADEATWELTDLKQRNANERETSTEAYECLAYYIGQVSQGRVTLG